MNVTLLLWVPPAVLTRIVTDPVPAGVTALMLVLLSDVNDAAFAAPNSTSLTVPRLVPVMVTVVPPAVGPDVGTDRGDHGRRDVGELVGCWSRWCSAPVVTVTSTVPLPAGAASR